MPKRSRYRNTLPFLGKRLNWSRHKRSISCSAVTAPSRLIKLRRRAKRADNPCGILDSRPPLVPSDNPYVTGSPLELKFSSPRDLFHSLITPISEEVFFNSYWEKKPLLIKRGGHSEIPSLFTLATLRKLAQGSVPLVFGRHVNVCRYKNGGKRSYGDIERGEIMTAALLEELWTHKKATVQFLQPQQFQDELWDIVSLLETYFNCLVGTNVYITPGGTQGLAPHYDDVEVFIVQLEGCKRWKLYPPFFSLPQISSPDLSPQSIGPPSHDFLLEVGDVLYFPRGTIHHASTPTNISHSTHITISTYQQNTWGNLLFNAFNSTLQHHMRTNMEYRMSLPIQNISDVSDSTRDKLQSMGECILDHMYDNHHIVILRQRMDFIATRLPPYDVDRDIQCPAPNAECMVQLKWPEHMVLVSDREALKMKEFDVAWETQTVLKGREKEKGEELVREEVYVYHSIANDQTSHMIMKEGGPQQPHGVRLPAHGLPALTLLQSSPSPIPASSLPLSPDDTHTLLTTLWVEGLINVT